jgi:hypothetical protein
MFALSVGLCSYNFFRAITLDPGTCPKPASDDELKSVCRNHSYLRAVIKLISRLLKILRQKAALMDKLSAFNVWRASPYGLNTVAFAINVWLAVISK